MDSRVPSNADTSKSPKNLRNSNKSSEISQNKKMKKLQLTKTASGSTTTNKKIGILKPQSPKNVIKIDDDQSPAPKISELAKLYEAKLRKIEKIKPKPTTDTIITKFFEENASRNDDSDFESREVPFPTPVVKPKTKKISTKKPRATKKGVGKNFPDIRKLVNPNYGKKESISSEISTENDTFLENQDLNGTSNKRVLATLDKFGFKAPKRLDDCDITALFGPTGNPKRKKIKPTLLMKKDCIEQRRLLEEKVSILLDKEYKQNVAVPISAQLKFECVSFLLENCISSEPDTFYINSNADPIDVSMEKYYKTGLFPVSTLKADYLLKDWGAIPGRERSVSPERGENPSEMTKIDEDIDFEALEREILDEKDPIPMEIDAKNEEIVTETPENSQKSQSSICQKDLDNIQAFVQQSKSTLNDSCEDLFADFDEEIICTDIDDEEKVEIVRELPPTEEIRPEIETIDMTQDSSPAVSEVNPSSESSEFSATKLFKQIDSQLELLSEICDNQKAFSETQERPVEQISTPMSEESCYVISSESEDEAETPVRAINDDCQTENPHLEMEIEQEMEDQEEDCEKTVIYFEQDPNFGMETELERSIVESLVDQTIIEEKSNDSIDLEMTFKEAETAKKTSFEAIEAPKVTLDTSYDEFDALVDEKNEKSNDSIEFPTTFEKPESPKVTSFEPIEPPKVSLNDSYDEFDAMVYGERKEPSPEVPKSPAKPPSPPKSSKLTQDFERLASLERRFAKKSEFKVKTRCVTPPPDYENMDEVKLEWEMKRFGLKYIKNREHRIKMLNHIYSRTHPFIEIKADSDQNVSLMLLGSGNDSESMSVSPIKSASPAKTQQNPAPLVKTISLEEKYGLVPPSKGSTKRKAETKNAPLKKIKSKPDPKTTKKPPEPTIQLTDFTDIDFSDPVLVKNDIFTSQFFEESFYILSVKQKGKLQWCSLPLHIAFLNVLRANSWLKLKILQYEPLEIEVLYKYFKNIGARFELSDLKMFLDKYCITFRSEN
ncbi:structure-specific endonuclease subunit SLX4 [Culicoides brevitarsis]|uniref:structure-specific endonuclease subunit SLX4 n=1 Tax=Culicoides brevitarsis TaxID=469753 RepID=UPI00307CA700